MRSFPTVLVTLVLTLTTAATATAFTNGHASSSDLAPIYIPNNTASLANQAAAAWNTMRLCATAEGVDLYPSASTRHPAITAYRDIDGQNYVWQLYVSGRGALAARPGTSNHGLGRAVDLALVPMRTWINAHGRAYAWAKVEAMNEWWHVNYVGGFHRPDPGTSLRFPNLRWGSGGKCQAPAVKEVQRRLGMKQDGDYGHGTRVAVVKFQRAHHLKADGRVGSKTWLALRKQTRHLAKKTNARVVGKLKGATAPMAGQDVRAVQGLLNAKFKEMKRPRRVKITGVLDNATVAAVKRFQQLRHLPVTGKVDDRTYAELIKKVVKDTPQLKVSDEGTNLVAGFEGERLCPYLDTLASPDVWTVGFGHTSAAGPPAVGPHSRCLSHAEAVALLHEDLDHYAVHVAKLVKSPTSSGEFNGMVSLSFNVGIGGFGGSTLLRLHNQRDYTGAAGQFKRWNRAGGRPVLGLTRRRRAECEMYVRGSNASVQRARPC